MATGKGSVKVRGKYKVEDDNIVFYEIPYGTRVESLMEEIGKACEEEKLTGIIDIRNETGKKTGLRLVIQTDKNASVKTVINQLFAKTNLQTSFSYNQVALVNKTPTELNLKGAIEVYVKHNIECLVREANFDLGKAKARLEVVEGLLKALEDIDNIVALIKKSASAAAAKQNLMDQYGFTEPQAKAIVDMKLGKLAGLEKMELNDERTELLNTIEELNAFVSDETLQKKELINRLTTFTNKYGDDRRTELAQIEIPKGEDEVALVEPEKCVVVLTESGLVKRMPTSSFRTQKRNGKGVKSQDDITSMVIRTDTVDQLMVFTDQGRMYRLLVNDIPVGTNTTKGQPIKSLITMENNENPTVIYSIYRGTDEKYVLFATKNGLVKKTTLEEYLKTKKKSGIAAISIKEGDSLASVSLVKDEDIILLTKNGMAIKFNSAEVSCTSRTTSGIKGITLNKEDEVIGMLPIRNKEDQFAIFSQKGLAKKIKLEDLPIQKRAGKGLSVYKVGPTTGDVVCGALISDEDNILIAGMVNNICISATEIPLMNRGTIGNQVLKGIIKSVSKI
jgi:DNA gyrase subunit A